MSPIKENWILNAHLKVTEIFEECQQSGEDWTTKVEKFFENEIPKIYDQLPWLNETPLHNLQSNQIVRFRGLIQDMHDPEFYMNTYILKNKDGADSLKPGKYLDVVSCQPNEEIIVDSPRCNTKDRNSYFCISIPGESEWVKENYVAQNKSSTDSCSATNTNESTRKRGFEDDVEEMEDDTGCTNTQSCNETSSDGKRLKEGCDSDLGKQGARDVSALKAAKFPFPDSEDVACLLKIYDTKTECLLNDIVEVIGILSLDPAPGREDSSSFIDESQHSMPPSLAPRLHVLSLEKKLHCNPLLPVSLNKEHFSFCTSALRELMGSVLDVAFLGDELAAEYFICHLISSVYLRQDIMPLGKFSLNLTGITKELQDKNYTNKLYNLLRTLTTHSYLLSMTLHNMNKLEFIPKKDYQENSLKSGFLQMPANLHLVVDETQLTAGQLDSKGVRNLTALGTLINWQKVDYDFQYHSLEQHTNVPVFIMSEGKAMITSDFQVRLDPKHTDVSAAFDEIESLLTPKVLQDLRTYLTLARLSQYSLTEDMQKAIQNDFVASRKHDDGMSVDDLHNLLTLAKLVAQSCGKLELTEDIWKSSKLLEIERKERLKSP